MTDTPISPLRRRMIEDMAIRKFAPKTQASYIRAVRNFTVFLGRSPDQASAEDLRRYQLHLATQLASTLRIDSVLIAKADMLSTSGLGHLVLPGFSGQFKKIRLTALRSQPG